MGERRIFVNSDCDVCDHHGDVVDFGYTVLCAECAECADHDFGVVVDEEAAERRQAGWVSF